MNEQLNQSPQRLMPDMRDVDMSVYYNPNQLNVTEDTIVAENIEPQFAAPEIGSMLIKGSVTESGKQIYRQDNGRFMSKDRVAEIGAKATNLPAEQVTLASPKALANPVLVNTNQEFLPPVAPRGLLEAPRTPKAPLIKRNFEAPTSAESMVVGSYVNQEGKPILEANELFKEVERMRLAGDRERFDLATEALWASARQVAITSGDDTNWTIANQFIGRKKSQFDQATSADLSSEDLEALNQLDSTLALTQEDLDALELLDNETLANTPKRTLKERALLAVAATQNAITSGAGKLYERIMVKNNGEARNKKVMAVAALGVVALGAAVAYRLNYEPKHINLASGDENALGNPRSGSGVGVPSGNLRGIGGGVPATELVPEGLPVPNSATNLATTEAAPTVLPQIVEMPSMPSGSTFTISEAWKPGNPTAWSWAESQGIPSNNVDNFLSEVMGAEWQEQARNMQIGDSLSATAEQIAKFKP